MVREALQVPEGADTLRTACGVDKCCRSMQERDLSPSSVEEPIAGVSASRRCPEKNHHPLGCTKSKLGIGVCLIRHQYAAALEAEGPGEHRKGAVLSQPICVLTPDPKDVQELLQLH